MPDPRHHGFSVGLTFEDRVGKYRVISLDGNRMTIEYPDGKICDGTVELKWRIHCNILADGNAAIKLPSSGRSTSYGRTGFFTHDEVFPIIAEVIEVFCADSSEYMDHPTLVAEFMGHPEAQLILDRPHDRTNSWWAGNMVAWFSKVFTDGHSIWDSRFERKKIGGAWAYRERRHR